tara:strand:- start:12397 stop:12708 length:312 start_codon:yes stop_codon:yes gene_type:complete
MDQHFNTLERISDRETSNAQALEILGRLRDLGAIRDQLLDQLDAYFQLKDVAPDLFEGNQVPIKTQWLGFRGELRLKITSDKGEVREIPERLVPSIIKRPQED